MKSIRKWPGALAVLAAGTTLLGVPVYEMAIVGHTTRPAARSSINTSASRGDHRLGNDPTVNDDDIITVRARGFTPKEPVEVGLGSLPSFDHVVIAASDGTLSCSLTVAPHASGRDVLTFTGLRPAQTHPFAAAEGDIEATVPELAEFYFTAHA